MIYFQLFLSPAAVKQRNLSPKCFHLIYKHVKKIWYESLLHLWHLLRYNESIWRNFGARSFIAETFLKNLEMDTWFHSQRNQSVNLHCKLIHWFLREWNSGLNVLKLSKGILKKIWGNPAMFAVNSKNTRTTSLTSLTSFWCLYC